MYTHTYVYCIYIYVYIQQLETTDIWDIYPLLRKIVKIHVTPPGDPRRLHPRCHPDWECPLPAWAVTCRILPVKNLKMAIDLAKMRIIPDNPEFSILIRLLGTQSFCHMGQFPCHAWVLSSTELPSSFWYLQNLEGSNEASWCLECIPRDILQEEKNHITSHDTCCLGYIQFFLWLYSMLRNKFTLRLNLPISRSFAHMAPSAVLYTTAAATPWGWESMFMSREETWWHPRLFLVCLFDAVW